MTTAIQPGLIQAMTQNVVYALPARRCLLMCDDSSPSLEQCNVVGFSAAKALTLSSGQAEVAGGFIRCTSGAVTVSLKAL